MPIEAAPDEQGRGRLVRIVTTDRGSMVFRMECYPAFDFARADHDVKVGAGGATFHSPGLSVALDTAVPLAENGKRGDRRVHPA